MKAITAIKQLMNEKNVKIAEMARALEVSDQNIWNTLSGTFSKSIQVDRMVKMLTKLNYKVVIVPYESKTQGIVIDEKD